MAAIAGISLRVALIRKKMIEVGAVSEETAKTAKELDVDEWFLTRGLAKIKGIRQTKDGHYYVEIKQE
jgi:hypothetical protein